jgi:hypothetical protein
VVSKDNTVAIADRCWQIGKRRWRFSLALTVEDAIESIVSAAGLLRR